MRPPSIISTSTNDGVPSLKVDKRTLLNSESDGRIFCKQIQNGEIIYNKKYRTNHDNFIDSITKSISKNHNIIVNPLSDLNSASSSSNSGVKLKRISSDVNCYSLDNYCEGDPSNKKQLSDYTISSNNIIVNKLSELDFEKLPLLNSKVKKKDSIVDFDISANNYQTSSNVVHRNKIKNNNNSCSRENRNRRSLQLPISVSDCKDSQISKRRHQIHSWYGTGYDTLFEELEQKKRKDNINIFNNLAGAKNSILNGTRESASLLENQTNNSTQTQRNKRNGIYISTSNQHNQLEGPQTHSLGGPSQPTRRRFGQILKSLVSRKSAKENTNLTPSLLSSSDLKENKTASQNSLASLTPSRVGNSTTSLNIINHRLWSVVPFIRRENSCSSLNQTTKNNAPEHEASLRKCNTVIALSQSVSSNLEPIKPLNRLRNFTSVGTCSRCSSLLSVAAAGSKYSLNISNGFMPASEGEISRISDDKSSRQLNFTCKLCLGEVKIDNLTKISQCGCSFCTECMSAYVEYEILEGAYEISCPDAMCPTQGILTIAEIMALTSNSLMEKHERYRLNREVELDVNRTWCPKVGCETVCLVNTSSQKPITMQPVSIVIQSACAVHCPTCDGEFCSGCKKSWHPTMSCEENTRRLAAEGVEDVIGIPFDNDLIKCCPMCSVPIEKDEGCAQMMCKRCKHVFCWYCLTSLDDDFLLRHYDKGPCKNKLGHSRASVVWHRAQVIGIFAGFGILLLVASPLLLLAAPCIVCCKCRICSGATKLEENDNEFDDVIALHR